VREKKNFVELFKRENDFVDLLKGKELSSIVCKQLENSLNDVSDEAKEKRLFIMKNTAIVVWKAENKLKTNFLTWLEALIAFISLNTPQ
jgi:hypothetical protein